MPRFFTTEFDPAQKTAVISGEDAVHIARVLRMQAGDPITICDACGTDYQGVVLSASPDHVTVELLSSSPSLGEPKIPITLYQALPKGDKFDFIIQKAVELGVRSIVPVLTSRCVSRPDEKNFRKKLERYQKISREAAKQCGRGILPQVEPLLSFPQAVQRMVEAGLPILFYEQSRRPLSRLFPKEKPLPASIAVMIGSEGGFSPEEALLAAGAGICGASLGSRILRCETAPIAALSILMYLCGE